MPVANISSLQVYGLTLPKFLVRMNEEFQPLETHCQEDPGFKQVNVKDQNHEILFVANPKRRHGGGVVCYVVDRCAARELRIDKAHPADSLRAYVEGGILMARLVLVQPDTYGALRKLPGPKI